ncbi:hypothetical protein M758_3G256000 [Ceratodon purpureus]|nr:hypothetical protein M758_3G256000 [Ceratodon purpureus]
MAWHARSHSFKFPLLTMALRLQTMRQACRSGVMGAGVAGEWVQLRYGSGGSGPLALYRDLVQKDELESGNFAQERAVEALEKLHHEMKQAEEARWWQPMVGWYRPPAKLGMYMHGTVGTGKTFLMDLFYNQVPVRRKRRVHFHSFMLDVHKRLHKHGRVPNAVQVVALQLFEQSRLLCLDEVEDIADALMLKRLFEVLWPMGIVVVATSNSTPDQLYQDGLNRHLFLPFIRQLKEYCSVYSLNSVDGNDYRRRHAWSGHLYHCSLEDNIDNVMNQIVLKLTGGAEMTPQPIMGSMGRLFHILASKDVARASFSYLCKSAFGAADYIAIAENFTVLLLDRIPSLADPSCENEARRFINLIDILYETNTILICSAAVPPDSLFSDLSQMDEPTKEYIVDAIEDTGIRIVGEGGSSGRSTLMIGNMEWSATGRQGASLADLAGASFTRKAAPRCVSRLLEMQSSLYVARARSVHIKSQLEQLALANIENRCQN